MRIGVIAAVVLVIGVVVFVAATQFNQDDTPPAQTVKSNNPTTPGTQAPPTDEPAKDAPKADPATTVKPAKALPTDAPAADTPTTAAANVEPDDDNPPGTKPPPPEPPDKPFSDPMKVDTLVKKYGPELLELPAMLGKKLGSAPPDAVYKLLDLKKAGASQEKLMAFVREELPGGLKVKLWTTVWLEKQAGVVRTGNSGGHGTDPAPNWKPRKAIAPKAKRKTTTP